MRRFLLSVLLPLAALCAAQGRSREPFTATDGHTYTVGETLRVATPSRGQTFTTILFTDRTSAMEVAGTVLSVLASRPATQARAVPTAAADRSIQGFTGKIAFFTRRDRSADTYALVQKDGGTFLKINLNGALALGEVVSNNPEYKSLRSPDNKAAEGQSESFSGAVPATITGAFGNPTDHTLVLEFALQNTSDMTREVRVNSLKGLGNTYPTITDYEGNTYRASKMLHAGKEYRNDGIIYTEIAAKAKAKFRVRFENIPASLSKIATAEIKMVERVTNTPYENAVAGTTTFRNVPVEWRNTMDIRNEEQGYSVKLFDGDVRFDIASVQASSKSRTVAVGFTLLNSAEAMDVCTEAGYMADAEGNVYNAQRPQVGGSPGGCISLPTGVKIKGSVTIPAVPAQLREAAFISIPVTYKSAGEYRKGTIEIRNLRLDWK